MSDSGCGGKLRATTWADAEKEVERIILSYADEVAERYPDGIDVQCHVYRCEPEPDETLADLEPFEGGAFRIVAQHMWWMHIPA